MKRGNRIVVDTNVLFEGLTYRNSGSSFVIDAWADEKVVVCVSTALLLEYESVLVRKLSAQRWMTLRKLFGYLMRKAEYTPIYFSWRPSTPDPGDNLVVDCAMNGNAVIVTHNLKDFRLAQQELGVHVMSPTKFPRLLNG